jgi:hypothetical protein
VFAASQFLHILLANFPIFGGVLLGLRLRRVTGVNDQLTNRESCLFCFVGQHEERKKKKTRKEFSFL